MTANNVTLDEQLPPDAFDDSWDWDGDGTVTLLDVIAAQSAMPER